MRYVSLASLLGRSVHLHFAPAPRRILPASTLISLLLLVPSPENQVVTQLKPGQAVSASLAGGKTHTYLINHLVAGHYIHARVEQQGIDLVVSILDQDGHELAQVDRPSGLQGPESISLIVSRSGNHYLQVKPLEPLAVQGRYRILLDAPRQSTPRDYVRISAERAVTEGERLRARSTGEALRSSIEQFSTAIDLWQSLGEKYEEALTHYGIGLSYRTMGELQPAISHFTRALELMRIIRYRYGEAMTQVGLAWTLLYLGELDGAQENFSLALTLRRAVNDRFGEALTLYGLGWAHALRNDNEEALNYFFRALSLRQQLNDRRGEIITLTGIGKVLDRQHRSQEALIYLKRAEQYVRELKNVYLEADTLSSIGCVFISLNDVPAAQEYFEQALLRRRDIGDRMGEATILYGMSRIAQSLEQLPVAWERMSSALGLIEKLRTNVTNYQLRTSYFATVRDYYDFAIDLLMQMHRENREGGYAATAFEVSERVRARVLLDLLADARADPRSDAPAELLEREGRLKDEINLIAGQMYLRPSGQKRDLGTTLESLMSQQHELGSQIRAHSPRYAALTRPSPISLAELQGQVLDSDTVLLEYALGSQYSYLWAVSTTSFDCYQLPGRAEIEAAANRLFSEMGLDRQRSTTGDATQSRLTYSTRSDDAARALSRALLTPVASHLGKKRLLFVADGILQYVPFAALPDPANETVPLVLEHEIVSAPSASVLGVLRGEAANPRPAHKTIAVLADPVFNQSDPRVRIQRVRKTPHVSRGAGMWTRPGLVQSRVFLPRLPFSRQEALGIIRFVPPTDRLLALDFEADRSYVLDNIPGNYRIIHFATHSFIDTVHPELSGIALSLVDTQGNPKNGWLRLHDIFNLRLNADLVVLSSCQTGLGKDVRGEGLIGLTRGFMYAGVPRVIASLWKIDDRAGAELMRQFYQALLGEQKTRPAAALRKAQIAMWQQKRWRNAKYWGAFTLQGDWR